MRGTVRALSELKNKVIKEGKENCSGGGGMSSFYHRYFYGAGRPGERQWRHHLEDVW